jgi:hypothetical protein
VKGTALAGSTVRLYRALTTTDCTQANLAATGTAAGFSTSGLSVSVPDDSITTFRATAADAVGNASPCSSSSIVYVEDSTPPAAPTITATDPGSPANHNSPKLKGTAEAGSTLTLYTNASCTPSGSQIATATAEAFASPGIPVSVAENSSTTFYATATDTAGNVSACSSNPITYVEASQASGGTPGPPIGGVPSISGAGTPDRSGPVMAVAGSVVKMGSGGAVRVLLSCPASEPGGCAGRLSLETLGRVRVSGVGISRRLRKRKLKLGKSSFRVAGGRSAVVRIRVSKENQRLVRKLKKVRVLAIIVARDQAENAQTTKRRLTLRAPTRKRRR